MNITDLEKNSNWKSELEKVQTCPQRQDSLHAQLKDLRQIANKFGLYDAADFLKSFTKEV